MRFDFVISDLLSLWVTCLTTQSFKSAAAFSSNPLVAHSGSKEGDWFGILMNSIKVFTALSSQIFSMVALAFSLLKLAIVSFDLSFSLFFFLLFFWVFWVFFILFFVFFVGWRFAEFQLASSLEVADEFARKGVCQTADVRVGRLKSQFRDLAQVEVELSGIANARTISSHMDKNLKGFQNRRWIRFALCEKRRLKLRLKSTLKALLEKKGIGTQLRKERRAAVNLASNKTEAWRCSMQRFAIKANKRSFNRWSVLWVSIWATRRI